MTAIEYPESLDTSRPVLILGGEVNAVAMARHLGGLGIDVRISGTKGCWAMSSRFCCESFPVPEGTSSHEYWDELLLSPGKVRLDGHLLFALNDDAISFLIDNHAALSARYVVERFLPDLRAAMLDKRRTLELAQSVDVPVPRQWPVATPEDLEALRDQLTFPVMVKPIHSHRFVEVFGQKLFIVENSFDEVERCVTKAHEKEVDVMVVEMIPGPDTLLSSYYTYIDADGQPLFHYTKRVIRRFPPNRGGAVYHVAEWLPETADLGRRFFEGIGWRGFANIEFKRDTRDGQLKVIEVNSRFTAAHRLLLESGAPVDLIAYCDLTDQPSPRFDSYTQDMRYWYPLRDFRSYLELRRTGELSLAGWLRSIPTRRTVFPLYSIRDPMPSLVRISESVARIAGRIRQSVT